MIIIKLTYKSKKVETLCNSFKVARKELGDKAAKKLLQRNQELQAFETLGDVPSSLPYRREKLTNKQNIWSIRIEDKWRLIIKAEKYEEDIRLIKNIIIVEVSKHYE